MLKRFYLKSFATPFSHGRSNLDYIIQLEKLNYNGLLDLANLYQARGDKYFVVRSKLITDSETLYEQNQMNGFEFTHHDVINNEEQRESIERKIKRMQRIKLDKNCFFYHHRPSKNRNINRLIEKVNEFLTFYPNSIFILFTQSLVNTKKERRVEKRKISDNIYFFEFYTCIFWEPNTLRVLGQCDDDLIRHMINDTIKIVKAKNRGEEFVFSKKSV